MADRKVYQGSLDGRHSFCVATTSWDEVERICKAAGFGISRNRLKSHWSITANPAQVEAALSAPGVLFRSELPFSNTYIRCHGIEEAQQ